ncbi:hypothetical protein BJV77DRAFT_1014458 [Russula vinacea]|nr:hypothetical protein BJV77DRAFT_1014458 [Russula vinacea]
MTCDTLLTRSLPQRPPLSLRQQAPPSMCSLPQRAVNVPLRERVTLKAGPLAGL